MVQDIELILSKEVKEVINSPLSLTLLEIYSTLYLGGGQPRWCERSQTSYYNQLAIDGIKKAKQMENSGVLTRTCELKKDMLIYVASLAIHITHANITDWLACEGLTKGFLKESQFIKLPDCWVNKDDVEESIKDDVEEEKNIVLETVQTTNQRIETRGRKSKHNR
jgi:hypothetical protein